MFKNPLKKFQQGGQVSQEQQEMLAAFVEWLPTVVEEFKNMQPEQIVEALNGMTKTPEGQKQVQSLMERFKQELNSPKMRFKEGGKIHQFICKHAKGGHVADCGCKQEGGELAISPADSTQIQYSREAPLFGLKKIFPSTETVDFTDETGKRVRISKVGNDEGFYYGNAGKPNMPVHYSVNQEVPEKKPFTNLIMNYSRNYYPVSEEDSARVNKIFEYGRQKKQKGGSLEGQYGTIDVDSRNNIRRVIDNIIGNSSTLSSVQRGFRNFRESAPGKVMNTLLPNPNSEVGMIGAALPVKGYRIPASNVIESPAIREPYMVNNKPSDFDIDKGYYYITKNLDFNKNIEPIDLTNLTKPTILGRIKGWLGSVKKEEGGTIEAQNGGYLQSDTPVHAAALAARKTVRVPWPGVGRRRMGAAMDANGGKYLYERGDVNGNTAQTSVSIPAPGDTIVRQSVATMDGWDNRTYPEGTDEYESVMKRFRPFVEYGIPAKQDGGGLNGFSYDKMSPEAARYNKQFINAKADSGRRFGWKHNVVSNTPNEKIETISLKEFPDSVEGQLYTFPNTAPKDSVLVGYPVERTIEDRTVINNHMPGWEQARNKWFEITKSQQGGALLSRKDMFNQANENRGFNRGVARTAYANALNGLRAGGLRGRELRQAARRMVIGQPAAEETIVETTTREPLGTLTRIAPLGTVQTSLPTQLAPTSTESYDLDSMSFNDAFATMRKAGKARFVWNGKVYTTELAEPKQEPNVVWDPENKLIWNDTRYAVPYGEASLRNTFLRKLGGKINK